MKFINRLLRKNVSPAQIAGFTLSNFIGLVIIIAGLQFFLDLRPLWQDEDSFVKKDYLVVNKRVTSAATLGSESTGFGPDDIADLERQPWVRRVGRFSANEYRVSANLTQGDRSMNTFMFFESIPAEFIDVSKADWTFREGDRIVPIIMSKDYLTLYNFGFASSAGLPKMSEGLIGSLPLQLSLYSEDGTRRGTFAGRVVGFSNRLNTILVPEEFMQWSNRVYGSGQQTASAPSRLIIDVSSPGDVEIQKYLEAHDWETAGENRGKEASFLLKVGAGVVIGVGALITLLSLFILMLSISLLMQKNRAKLHSLIMLGYPLRTVGAPYRRLICWVSLISYVAAVVVVYLFRGTYIGSVAAMTGGVAFPWLAPLVGLGLTLLAVGFNLVAVNRKVKSAFRT